MQIPQKDAQCARGALHASLVKCLGTLFHEAADVGGLQSRQSNAVPVQIGFKRTKRIDVAMLRLLTQALLIAQEGKKPGTVLANGIAGRLFGRV